MALFPPERQNICRKIGLTGGIASGKSQVCEYFLGWGVPVVDADVVARQLVEPELPAWREIRQRFGDGVLQADGSVNRRILRTKIFTDLTARQDLEAILHPRIREAMQRAAAELDNAYCILCIPLLVETEQMDSVDRVLVIDCDPALQRERLAYRDGLSAEQITAMLDAQCTREERLKHADDIIDNHADLSELYRQTTILKEFYSTWSSH